MDPPEFHSSLSVVMYISPRKLIHNQYISSFNVLHFGLFSYLYTLSVTVLRLWVAEKCSKIGLAFNGAETNCGISHILGILLMNSYDLRRGTRRPWALTSKDGKSWLQNILHALSPAVQQGLFEFEETPAEQAETKRQTRKAQIMEVYQQLTTSAHCAEGTVISELLFPATQGAVRKPPVRVRHHSLLRLKDFNCQ